jgi:dTDP-4-amino-4,6-dideoxygalactose transaminase
MKVPLLNLKITDSRLREETDAALKRILDTAAYIGGDEVRLFAEEFAAYCGGGFCVPVANGTDALILALKALGVGPGDEVITVPFTFIASAEAITAVGASVKFVDVHPKTYTMDPALLEKAIGPKTKSIIPVHLFGHPCDMDPIRAIAQKHKLSIVEDAAQAHGAAYKGKRAGLLGDIACFSFYPTKNLGGFGDGGAVVCHSKELADKVTQIANHGRASQYFHDIEGLNSRLDGVQAAFLRLQLKRLEAGNERRRAIAARYAKVLNGHKFIRAPFVDPSVTPVYHLYCVESDHREKLMELLKKEEIGNGVYYPLPLHLQPAYQRLNLKKGSFPVSERASEKILALPMHPTLTDEQIDHVCQVIQGFKG